jgi:hypothetical protein
MHVLLFFCTAVSLIKTGGLEGKKIIREGEAFTDWRGERRRGFEDGIDGFGGDSMAESRYIHIDNNSISTITHLIDNNSTSYGWHGSWSSRNGNARRKRTRDQ